MTQDLGSAVLTLTTDVRGVSQGIDQANAQLGRLGDAAEEANRKLTFTQLAVSAQVAVDGVERMGGALQETFGKLDMFTSQLAYTRGESISINTIFGEAAETIFRFGDTSAQSAGIAAKAFNELAAPIGTLLVEVAGLTQSEAAQWTTDLAQRASDLAFVFNTDTNTALAAFGAAIRGEVEPIREFGVSFNAVMVEGMAQAQTGKATAELTEQDKALARLQIVMEQTGQFQGKFADNSDLLFVKTATFRAELDELAGDLGSRLIPVQSQLLDMFTLLPPQVQLAAFAFAQFAPPLFEFAAGLGQAVIGIGGLIQTLPRVATAMSAVASAIGTTNLVLGGLLIALGLAAAAYQIFSDKSDDAAEAAERQSEAQSLLETNTREQLEVGREQIAQQLAAVEAEGAHWESLNRGEQLQRENIHAERERRATVEELQGQLGTYDKALGKLSSGLETNKLRTDDVTQASEELTGQTARATEAVNIWDAVLGIVNGTLDTLTGRSNDAFAAIEKFRNVPTQEQLELDAAIAGVNLRLIEAKIRLEDSTAAHDGNEEQLKLEVDQLDAEKDRLDLSRDALEANRERTVAVAEAKIGASGAIAGMAGSEAFLTGEVERASLALSLQSQEAANLAADLATLGGNAANAAANMAIVSSSAVPGSIPGYQSGVEGAPGGWAWVGESGPELVNLPQGSDVLTAAASERLLRQASETMTGRMANWRGRLVEHMAAMAAAFAAGTGSGRSYIHGPMPPNVERWRSLVSGYFGGQTQNALNVIYLESGGDPNAYNPVYPYAAGLMQIAIAAHGGNRAYWSNPDTNVGYGANLYRQQGWAPWEVAPLLGLAKGTSYVPRDMLAYLHRGEAVVPAEDNRRSRPSVIINVAGSILSERDLLGLVRSAARDGRLELRGVTR